MSRLSYLSKSRGVKKQRRATRERRSSKAKQLENRQSKRYKSGLGFRKEFPDDKGKQNFPSEFNPPPPSPKLNISPPLI